MIKYFRKDFQFWLFWIILVIKCKKIWFVILCFYDILVFIVIVLISQLLILLSLLLPQYEERKKETGGRINKSKTWNEIWPILGSNKTRMIKFIKKSSTNERIIQTKNKIFNFIWTNMYIQNYKIHFLFKVIYTYNKFTL